LLWIPVVLLVMYVLLPTSLNSWPPDWVDRRKQRQMMMERVQFAGGWVALQRDCDALVEQYRERAFVWYRGHTNQLPPAIAALKPKEVRFYSPALLRDDKDEPPVPVVRIKVFGAHSTGGHSYPYFGLEVVSGPGVENYRPRPSRGGVSGNGYRSYSTVTDRIYEIY
jgi:hypothetical protein